MIIRPHTGLPLPLEPLVALDAAVGRFWLARRARLWQHACRPG
jgi:hypothetical protein